MRKVYQTIINNTNGNCWAACIASLLEIELDEVPNFAEAQDAFDACRSFMKTKGFEYEGYWINPKRHLRGKEKYPYLDDRPLPEKLSINGFYEAVVYSPKYFNEKRYSKSPYGHQSLHVVIVDAEYNIVHDPNPNNSNLTKYPMADELGKNGILGVTLWK